MTIGAVDSAILGPLLSDAETAEAFADASRVRAMVRVEAALARAQGRLGMIPEGAAAAIDRAADGFIGDPAALGQGTKQSGIPTIALVAQLREAVGGEAARWVHWGATSQDIVDTALALDLADLLDGIEGRLRNAVRLLADLAEAHRDTVTVARTRAQQALPTTFGAKAAGWLMPHLRNLDRLAGLKERVLIVQLGGASRWPRRSPTSSASASRSRPGTPSATASRSWPAGCRW